MAAPGVEPGSPLSGKIALGGFLKNQSLKKHFLGTLVVKWMGENF